MRSCSACGTVAPEGARFCASCGEALDERAPPDERKLATVLFADLVGSTARAEDEDPERIRALLDRFYDAMREEIELAGGTVEKFAGDAVMAAFGAPAAHEDHAERALHAGLAMQRRLRADFGRELALRIGVNTGEVVSGRPREGSSFVSGDAVNVAARLAHDRHEVRLASVDGPPVGRPQELDLDLAPDEHAREGAGAARTHQAERAHHGPCRNGLALALGRDGALLAELERTAYRGGRSLADEHLARRRRLLEAGGDVHGVARDE